MNKLYRQINPQFLLFVLIVFLIAVGIYIEWEPTTEPNNPSESAPEEPPAITFPDDSILRPTRVQTYDNGTYSVTLNGTIRINFIETKDGSPVWPRDGSNRNILSIQSDTVDKNLRRAIKRQKTYETDRELMITGVESRPSDEPDVSKTVTVTFNDQLSLHNLKLMTGPKGEWIALPTGQFEGGTVDLVELPASLKAKIYSELQKSGTQRPRRAQGELPIFPEAKDGIRARVIHVYDGDTFKAKLRDGSDREVVVRMEGMDCPESSRNDKCEQNKYRDDMSCAEEIRYGKRAKRVARQWLSGRNVVLVPSRDDGFEEGHYGRMIAYVRMTTGEDYGLKMVNEGYCKDTSRSYPHERGETYRRYERPLKPLN